MPLFTMNKTLTAAVIAVCAVVFAVLLYKALRAVIERLGFYRTLKKYCKEHNGIIKKNNGLFRSVFSIYPGYDAVMTVNGQPYGVKFFPKYLKNKNVLIESEKRACILKNTGVMGVSWRGSLPGVRTLVPDMIDEVIARRIKIDLSSANPEYNNILLFSPKCKRIYYVKKAERAEAYNGDVIFGYTAFYDKEKLIDFLSKEKR